jgi:hypothetical protein
MVPQRLDLDFVAPPLATRAGRWLLAAGLLVAAAGAAQFATTWLQWQHLRAAFAQLPTPAAARPAPPTRTEAASLRAAQGVARELTAPWSELLNAIEAAGTKDVALVAVEPVAARQTVRITADARHADAMLDMVEQLKRQSLADVQLVSHQAQPQRPGAPLRFQVQARWSGAAQPDRGVRR